MSGTDAVQRDGNHAPVLMGIDSTDSTKVLPFLVNPASGALILENIL